MKLVLLFFAAVLNLGAQTPLTDFAQGERYKGQEGGLYGEGRNEPDAALKRAAEQAAQRIEPLDANGRASESGLIGFVTLGMSNTAQKFTAFQKLNAPHIKPLRLVNAAVGGMDALAWAEPEQRRRQDSPDPWETADRRIRMAGLSHHQVQIVWMLHALAGPGRYGEYPKSAQLLEQSLASVITRARKRWPNLRLIFISSRAFAGYAKLQLNPEPYTYESGFAVRSSVLSAARTNHKQGAVVLWGPYFWANGRTPRADRLVWLPEDFTERDGTHPSEAGARKAAALMQNFFIKTPTTQRWFTP